MATSTCRLAAAAISGKPPVSGPPWQLDRNSLQSEPRHVNLLRRPCHGRYRHLAYHSCPWLEPLPTYMSPPFQHRECLAGIGRYTCEHQYLRPSPNSFPIFTTLPSRK